MIKGLPTIFGSLYKHTQVVNHFVLTAEVIKSEWSKRVLVFFVGGSVLLSPDVESILHN